MKDIQSNFILFLMDLPDVLSYCSLTNMHVKKKKKVLLASYSVFPDEQFNLFLTVLLLCQKIVYRMSRKLLGFLNI